MPKTIDPHFDFFATLTAINAHHAANLRAAELDLQARSEHAAAAATPSQGEQS